jgi:hypothetical protein
VTLTLTSLAMISAPPIKIICSLTEVSLPCTSLSGSPCPSCGASFGHNKKALRRGDAIIPQLSLPVKGFCDILSILYNFTCCVRLRWDGMGRITTKRGGLRLPTFHSPFFLLPYAEHPPQDGGNDGRGAQDHDLHGGYLPFCMGDFRVRGHCQYMRPAKKAS